MAVRKDEQTQLEDWLTMLITTYQYSPSEGLLKAINYYIDRVISLLNNDQNFLPLCQYYSMKKFWQWKLKLTS